MATVSARIDEWSAIDPVRDVHYLAESILREEARAASAPELPNQSDLTEQIVTHLLPPELAEPLRGRKSTRIPMLHMVVRTYTSIYFENPERTWNEFCKIRRYLVMHALINSIKSAVVDKVPVDLTTAETQELLLDLIRRGNDGEFSKMPNYRSYPVCFIAVEVICYFMHPQCAAFTIFVEKFFRDMRGCPQELVRMMNTRPWHEAFAVVRLFGFASSHPVCCLWLLQHPETLASLLRYSHQAGKIVERVIQREKPAALEQCLNVLCQTTIKKGSVGKYARIMGTYAACMSALTFSNMTHHFTANFDDYLVLRRAVFDAELIQNFHLISRQIMRWLSPGRFMSCLLLGVYRCMEMDKTVQLLFLDDFKLLRKHKISAGWESLRYFNHQTFHPSHASFLICHALLTKILIGSHWAAAIITWVLQNCSEEVCRPIIERFGYELLDLAHLLYLIEPLKISVQSVVMQALLKHAGFSHKLWDKADSFVGELKPVKKVPEFCLEAALYCRRASLEEELPTAEKQHRVKLADDKKDQGNTEFKKGRYREAIELYTEALAVCPLSARSKQAVYYSNRAECYLRVSDAQRAIHDCNRALCLDEGMRVKVQWRRSRAYQSLDLDYPAWLDMYCIKDEWKANNTDTSSGVDFAEMEDAYREKICLVEREEYMELERKVVDHL